MSNAERRLTPLLAPPPPLLLLLFTRSLLLISSDAPVGAADEGGGLHPNLSGDNGENASTTPSPTGVFLGAPAFTEGEHLNRSLLPNRI